MKLLLATGNKGKIVEIERILEGSGIEIVPLSDFPSIELPPETGETFEENALIKARAASDATGLTALADDSGIEIDALDGRPGVYSARYAGAGATDEENNEKLIRELEGVENSKRTARYRCVIAVVGPPCEGERFEACFDGTFEGSIAREPRGTNGFGYDPYFLLSDRDMTAAELLPEVKNRISHRGKAMMDAAVVLRDLAIS